MTAEFLNPSLIKDSVDNLNLCLRKKSFVYATLIFTYNRNLKWFFKSLGGYNKEGGFIKSGRVSINIQGCIAKEKSFWLNVNHYSPKMYCQYS